MTSSIRPSLLTLAAVAFLAGCGADSGVSPTNTPVTLDDVFKEMSLPAIAGAASAASGVDASAASAGISVPKACSYATASQSFVCAPITASGLTINQSYQLLNSSGSPLSAFDVGSVSAVRMISTTTGTETSAAGTFTLNGQSDQTLSGLQTSKHILNGTAILGMNGTFSGTGSAETVIMTTKVTTANLVMPAKAGPNAYPESGTITVDTDIALPGQPSIPVRLVLTFDGTSKVKVTTNGITIPGCSTIDLSSANPGCS